MEKNNMKLPTLYKRTSVGAVQEWTIEIDGDKYRTHSGQRGGVITTSAWTVCKGKNVGKSNETTPEEQSNRDAHAKWKKKTETGYFENLDSIDEVDFKPMLAKKYEDQIKYVEKALKGGTVFVQPKLDGIRCIARKEGLFTRTGKPHTNLAHVWEVLEPFFKVHPSMVLDGEIYADKLSDDFEKICSIARKAKPNAEERQISRENVQYWMYDAVDLNKPAGFNERFHDACCLLTKVIGKTPYIQYVETYHVTDQAHMDDLYGQFNESGYEGQMIRLSESEYEQKRSKALLKRKEFIDEEFVIVDIEEGVGNRAGHAGKVVFRNENGTEFRTGLRGTYSYFKELLENKNNYVGKKATVRYQNRTEDNVPRFGQMIAIRDYE
jgi:ATP-dependent DNA ligase